MNGWIDETIKFCGSMEIESGGAAKSRLQHYFICFQVGHVLYSPSDPSVIVIKRMHALEQEMRSRKLHDAGYSVRIVETVLELLHIIVHIRGRRCHVIDLLAEVVRV